jgi:hypothetical protein
MGTAPPPLQEEPDRRGGRWANAPRAGVRMILVPREVRMIPIPRALVQQYYSTCVLQYNSTTVHAYYSTAILRYMSTTENLGGAVSERVKAPTRA